MNYLAHLFLAGTDPLELTGSLMGDFLRGVDRTALDPRIESGIVHHLAVDSFTDSHRHIRTLRGLFSPVYRRYSGIVLDVYFDNLLLKRWDRYSSRDSHDTIADYYRILLDNRSSMPPRMRRVVSLLVQYDIFNSYRTVDGLAHALDRIGERFSKPIVLSSAVREIWDRSDEIEVLFVAFFDELVLKYGRR